MWISCQADILHKTSSSIFSEKKKKMKIKNRMWSAAAVISTLRVNTVAKKNRIWWNTITSIVHINGEVSRHIFSYFPFSTLWAEFADDKVVIFFFYPAFTNSVDPDQLASEEANWSGSALFAIKYVNL